MLRLTNIDLVGAKTGRKLSWLDRAINNTINTICSYGIILAIIAWVIFCIYLAVKLAIFLINV